MNGNDPRDSNDDNNQPLYPPSFFLFHRFLPPLCAACISRCAHHFSKQFNVTIVRPLKACHPQTRNTARFSPFPNIFFSFIKRPFHAGSPPADRSPSPFMGSHRPGESKRVDRKRPWILGEPVRIMPDTSRCRFTGY